MGTGVFWIPGVSAALSFCICSMRSVILRAGRLRFGQGFTCGAAFWVRLRGLSVTCQWNRDGLSKWMRTQCCLSILSFKGMLLHLMPPPWLSSQDWKIPPKLSRYCCNFFFLFTSSYLLHICFLFMELYTLPVFYEIAKICRFRALDISNRAKDVVMSQYAQMCWSRKLFCMLKPSNEVRWCTLLVSVITTSCQGKVLLPTVA